MSPCLRLWSKCVAESLSQGMVLVVAAAGSDDDKGGGHPMREMCRDLVNSYTGSEVRAYK